MLGAYIVLFPGGRVLTWVIPFFFFELPALLFLGIWFLLQLFLGSQSVVAPEEGGGVAFFAHIGGFVFGLLAIRIFSAGRPRPVRASVLTFDEHVERALASLPADLRAAMSNVEIVVEDENPDDPDLFGLYFGIPLTERHDYAGVLPDKIAIYRLPLEEEFGDDPAVLEEEIRITVLHEVAHHFGIDEDRLDELGWS